MSASGIGGRDVNADDPSSPSSSPDQKLKTRFRRRCSFENVSAMRQHGRRARGVVVGAAMHASGFLFGRERQAVGAGSEMIVVRAERDPGLGTRRRRTSWQADSR